MSDRGSEERVIATTPTHSSKAEEMLEGTGCAAVYELFELCLADNDRSFAKCKTQMMTFRKCMDTFALENDANTKKRVAKGEQVKSTW